MNLGYIFHNGLAESYYSLALYAILRWDYKAYDRLLSAALYHERQAEQCIVHLV
jgi:hypothetical protein